MADEKGAKSKSSGCGWIALAGVLLIATCKSIMPEREPEELFTLAQIEAKILPDAVAPISKDQYTKLYQKLGPAPFEKANELSRWAAIIAASSTRCDKVEIVEVSDKSEPDHIEWFADCKNGERYEIVDFQAEEEMRSWEGTEDYSKPLLERVKPNSDKLESLPEWKAVSICDETAQAVLKSKNSYDPSGQYDFSKHPTSGRVTIVRGFDAENSFGGTVSSEYRCLLNATSLIEFSVKEPNGWEILYSK
ncbi:hypothetical protein [Parasphingorhabdus sp.]|uniref:hypothetical protein n=1 Tax=Parasphingorhabdus sp. TaxID=2709688 RepID=UPI003D275E0D